MPNGPIGQATFEIGSAARAGRLLVSGLRRDIDKTGSQEPVCRHRQLMAGLRIYGLHT